MAMRRILIWSLIIVLFLNHAALVYADEVPEEVSETGEISESDEMSETNEVPDAEEVSDETIDLVDIFYTKTTGEDHTLHVPFNRS